MKRRQKIEIVGNHIRDEDERCERGDTDQPSGIIKTGAWYNPVSWFQPDTPAEKAQKAHEQFVEDSIANFKIKLKNHEPLGDQNIVAIRSWVREGFSSAKSLLKQIEK
jgi:hypothetical protein